MIDLCNRVLYEVECFIKRGWFCPLVDFHHKAHDRKESLGGLGGFFNGINGDRGMRWKHYLESWDVSAHPYCEALREEVLRLNLRECGDWNQSESENGVPVFEDDSIGCFSQRAWGDMLAAIWSEHDDIDYCYMDFYHGCGDPGSSKDSAMTRNLRTSGDARFVNPGVERRARDRDVGNQE